MEGGRIGRYRIVRELGRGGSGVVYEAEDVELARRVAVKVLDATRDTDARERFAQEARLAAQIDHESVVRVHDVGADGERAFLVMELLEGPTLREWGERPEPTLRDRAAMVARVSRAVAEAHRRAIVHRDLKPENVIVVGGRPVVTDFGIARALEGAPLGRRLTQTGQAIGTPAFMAPEQFAAARDRIGPATDVWALGVILYELATGCLPFVGETWGELSKRVLNDEPDPPSKRQPAVGRDLDRICAKAMEKDPRERYADAGELAADLERFVRGETVAVRPPGVGRRLRRWVRRHRLAAVGIAAAVLVVVGWAGAAAWGWLRDEKAYRVHRARAREAEAEGRWQVALDEWRQALEERPRRVEARRGIALSGVEAAEMCVQAELYEAASMMMGAAQPHLELLGETGQERIRRVRAVALNAATLAVATDPPGAEMWWEGRFVTLTPGQLMGVRAGLIEVEVRLEGYVPVRLPVEISRGQVVEARLELIPVERVPEGMRVVTGGPFRSGRDGERVDVPTFLIDRTEVTVGAFLEFVRATGREFRVTQDDEEDWEALRECPDLPMAFVTWDDAQAYAEWKGARLPTRLEWEKAARGIDGRELPWGDGMGEANWDRGEESGVAAAGESPDESPYGCRDMAGNVAEWTADEGFVPGERLVMGGHWQDPPDTVALWRPRSLPVRGRTFLNLIGFRCARTP